MTHPDHPSETLSSEVTPKNQIDNEVFEGVLNRSSHLPKELQEWFLRFRYQTKPFFGAPPSMFAHDPGFRDDLDRLLPQLDTQTSSDPEVLGVQIGLVLTQIDVEAMVAPQIGLRGSKDQWIAAQAYKETWGSMREGFVERVAAHRLATVEQQQKATIMASKLTRLFHPPLGDSQNLTFYAALQDGKNL